MSEDDNKIIPFESLVFPAKIKERDATSPRCRHIQIEVYEDRPVIECTKCGAVVEPYEWLRNSVSRWQSITHHLEIKKKCLENQIKDLEKRKSSLKKAINESEAEKSVMVFRKQRDSSEVL